MASMTSRASALARGTDDVATDAENILGRVELDSDLIHLADPDEGRLEQVVNGCRRNKLRQTLCGGGCVVVTTTA
jgi:hypothetical protein